VTGKHDLAPGGKSRDPRLGFGRGIAALPGEGPEKYKRRYTVASEIRGSRRTRNAAALSKKKIPQTHANGGRQTLVETIMPPPNAEDG